MLSEEKETAVVKSEASYLEDKNNNENYENLCLSPPKQNSLDESRKYVENLPSIYGTASPAQRFGHSQEYFVNLTCEIQAHSCRLNPQSPASTTPST